MMIKKHIQALALAVLILSGFASCNKDVENDKVINVTFHGYNIGDEKLEVSIDTVVYDQNLLNNNGQIGFSMVYPFPAGKQEAIVHVKSKESGKELFQQKMSLANGQLEFYYSLININGKLLEMNPPAADTGTNKLGFYIYYPESNEPIDIFLYNPNTGAGVYLAQNVIPQTWVYTDYLPTQGLFQKSEVEGSAIYFLKAGTFDWAFNNDEYLSQATGFGTYIPHMYYNLNKVQSYFVIPSPYGWQTDIIRLFPNPKSY